MLTLLVIDVSIDYSCDSRDDTGDLVEGDAGEAVDSDVVQLSGNGITGEDLIWLSMADLGF